MATPAPYQHLRGSDITCKLWKVLNLNMTHHKFTYKVGLNVLDQKFKPSGDCTAGGLYVSWAPWKFFQLYGDDIRIAEVKLPPDAAVWTTKDKLKTDRLILGEVQRIEDMKFMWSELVKDDGRLIRYVQNPDSKQCMAAVQDAGTALKWIDPQTPELCLAAVRRYGPALACVKNQTQLLCRAAILENWTAIIDVRDLETNLEMQELAISQHENARGMIKCEIERRRLARLV